MNDDLVGTPSPGATGHRSDVGWERATLEKLAFSALAEQRAARRWTVFWRLMWLLLAGAGLWMVFRSDAGVAAVSTPHTALIEIRGEIAAGAAAADNIYVDKASLVGSIGVLMDGFGFTGLMDKLGVERRLMTADANKAMLDP